VAVKHTGVFGCSTKWQEKIAASEAERQKIAAQPVSVEKVDAAGLKKLRANPSKHVTMISFWATWCGSCIVEFSDLQDTYRMYGGRDFDLVTVAANMPDEQPSVTRLLQKKHATSRNLLFGSDDTAALQAAFDPTWQSAVPYTVVLDTDGKVIYKTLGSVDLLEVRRKILAAMPSDYIGFNKYWTSGN
jgi:thiol-disulfide isomerase/thioredoxin